MFLSTALIICLSFLTVGLCARLNLDGPLNFIPMAESQKPCQRVSNADRKVFANPESFCDKFIIG